MNHREKQKYQLSTGSCGQNVRVIKQLLHSNPQNSYQMDRTDVFDAKLRAAVTEFQRAKRLSNTDGTVSAETWSALGANALPAQVDILAVHDGNLRYLLKSPLPGNDRALTPGEIQMAQRMFKTSIDYNKVVIHNGKYFDLTKRITQPDNTFMTPNGEIYAPPNVYSNDYSGESEEFKAVIIHEMSHVWQWQRNIKNVRTSAIGEVIWHLGDYDAAYYYKLQEYTDLKEFGLEQQATIIEDYYRVFITSRLTFATDVKGKTRNLNFADPNYSVKETKRLLQQAMSKFTTDPNY